MKIAHQNFAAKKLFIELDGGLGNRIRPALSALFMGHKLKIPVAFSWIVTTSCLCPAHMLFKSRFTLTERQGPYLRYRPGDPESEKAFEAALRSGSVLRLKSSVYFKKFHSYFPEEAEAWLAKNIEKYFIPQDNLMKEISSFAYQFHLQNALGVHVRRGDRIGSPLLPRLSQYVSIIDRPEHRQKTIFLATDDGLTEADSTVLAQMRVRYGGRIVYRQKQSIGRDLPGVRDALIDLWLLRCCQSIIGAKVSTFSETAAIGRSAVLL